MKAVRADAVIDEVRDGLHVTLTGSGTRTVVLVHGFSDNLSTWRRVVPALAVGRRVVAVDLPSHGLSTRAWRRPLLDGYVDVIDEVLDSYGIDGPVNLIGNSMGGAVSALFAHQRPDRVESVVLIGMPGVHGVPRLWRAAASRPAAAALKAITAPIPLAVLRSSFAWAYTHAAVPHAGSIDPATLASYRASYPDRARLFELHPLGRALLRDLRRVRLDRVLGELPMPVLQLWGRFDLLVPARHAPHRRANIAVLPGCGHCPQLDAPDAVLQAVLPFLAAAAGTTTATAEAPDVLPHKAVSASGA